MEIAGVLLFILFVQGCGGGGSESNQSQENDNNAGTNSSPVAIISGDTNVVLGQSLELSAANSQDDDGDSLTYQWYISSMPSGSGLSLSPVNLVDLTLTPDVSGSYTIGLTVSDGQASHDASHTVTVVREQVDITDVEFVERAGNCDHYHGSYVASASDLQRNITFSAHLDIADSEDKCVFSSNEIPNHSFNDGSAHFATPVSEQDGNYAVAKMPKLANTITALSLQTTNVVFLNGVTLDLLAAACYDVGNEPLGQEKIGCGENEIDNPWRYDPMSPLNNFGTDAHNAHSQPDGTYHYHGNPVAMFDQQCDVNATSSPVIGFAADGFPVYGHCYQDDGGVIRKARSSYQLRDNGGPRQTLNGRTPPLAGQGVVASNYYDGQFRGDYVYVEGSGDLDECNGMTIDGQYGYYITDSYPWVLACFKGEVDSSFIKNAVQLQNTLHEHH